MLWPHMLLLLLCCAAAETGGSQRRIFSTLVRPEQNPLWQRRVTKPRSSSFTKNHTMFWLNYAPDQICAPPTASDDEAFPVQNIDHGDARRRADGAGLGRQDHDRVMALRAAATPTRTTTCRGWKGG